MNIPFSRWGSWVALLAALALWAGVGYFASNIAASAEEHQSKIANMEQQELESAAALRLHALARDTKDARAQLDTISNQDILEILDTIEALARDTGIPIQIGAPSISSMEASPVHVATFVIEARGTFPQVTHAIALLESFSIPSVLDQLQLERLPSAEGSKSKSNWRMVAQIRIFTTADIPAL